MEGFPLGRGGGGRRSSRDNQQQRGIPPENLILYGTGGSNFQLWQQPEQHQQQRLQPQPQQFMYPAPTILSFGGDETAGSSGGGDGGGLSSCQDCGNQAKKDCAFQRCRTCCKSRGFDCATHVKSTWVPAAKRRERHQQQQQQQLQLVSSGEPSLAAGMEPSKRPRAPAATSSGERRALAAAPARPPPFPREVCSEAVFRCVRLGPVDEDYAGGAGEVAYQTTVSIGGHVFKGILHDHGPAEPSAAGGRFGRRDGTSSPASTAAAGTMTSSGDIGGGGNVAVSSAVLMDPYPTPLGSFMAGTPFFPPPPRS